MQDYDRNFPDVEGRFRQRLKEIGPNGAHFQDFRVERQEAGRPTCRSGVARPRHALGYCRDSSTENSPLRMRSPRLSA
jgi:hypothetical protein